MIDLLPHSTAVFCGIRIDPSVAIWNSPCLR